MASETSPSLNDELAAAIAWWREAGVDRSFSDEAQSWLTHPNDAQAEAVEPVDEPEAKPPAPPVARLGGDPAVWPTDLAAFRAWWLDEPSLDQGGGFPRVAPRGEPRAKVMLLVPMPEAEDGDRLLSGREGRLAEAILRAMEIAPAETYFAAALPRHTPLPDWPQLAAAGLGDVLSRHIELAAPTRVIAFGRLVLPLLGHDMAQASAPAPYFNHEATRVPVLAAPGLDRLLRSAATRASFWRRWLDWTSGEP